MRASRVSAPALSGIGAAGEFQGMIVFPDGQEIPRQEEGKGVVEAGLRSSGASGAPCRVRRPFRPIRAASPFPSVADDFPIGGVPADEKEAVHHLGGVGGAPSADGRGSEHEGGEGQGNRL